MKAIMSYESLLKLTNKIWIYSTFIRRTTHIHCTPVHKVPGRLLRGKGSSVSHLILCNRLKLNDIKSNLLLSYALNNPIP